MTICNKKLFADLIIFADGYSAAALDYDEILDEIR